MSSSILETKGLCKAFGGLTAVDEVDLSVETGRITSVIGPNGAGKTTLFNLIAGVYMPSSGEIYFEGKPLGNAPPHKRAALGIARTFQNVLLFDNMTALENVMTGQHPRSRYGFFEAALRLPKAHREEETISLKAKQYLNLVGLGMYSDRNPLSLPLGQQKLLTIARALATEPRLLLLDEPGPQRTHQAHPGDGHHRCPRRARHGFGYGHCRMGHRPRQRPEDSGRHCLTDPEEQEGHCSLPR